MKYVLILSLFLIGCAIGNHQSAVKNRIPKSDRYIHGSYSHNYSRQLVAYEKVYEFSASGECYGSALPLGPDSHGKGADFHGKYFINNDTLHAFFYQYSTWVNINGKREYFDGNGNRYMVERDTVYEDFLILNNDSIYKLPFKNSENMFILKSDSLVVLQN